MKKEASVLQIEGTKVKDLFLFFKRLKKSF